MNISSCLKEEEPIGALLPPFCPIIARKFVATAADAVVKLYSSCKAGLHILACDELETS